VNEVSVLHIWYCRGCKRNVEAECKPEDEVVKCPNCDTEKNRFSPIEPKR